MARLVVNHRHSQTVVSNLLLLPDDMWHATLQMATHNNVNLQHGTLQQWQPTTTNHNELSSGNNEVRTIIHTYKSDVQLGLLQQLSGRLNQLW